MMTSTLLTLLYLAAASSALLDPGKLNERAPDSFRARFETSEGAFVVEVTREWAPLGADRFYNLVKHGFYDGTRFFRVLAGFVVQFGVHGDPEVQRVWGGQTIKDDPVKESNRRGTLTFATSGTDTRTTQLFINLADNATLDASGFAPFGVVAEGMDVVERFYVGYGEMAPDGKGPDYERLVNEGNAYLEKEFPELDHIRKAVIVE